jgi:hypothetical protein
MLVVKSRLVSTTVTNFEMGILPTDASIAKMRQPLEAAGIEFIAENGGGAGVRLRDVATRRGSTS